MPSGSPQFDTTLWTQVLLAARQPDSSDGQRALARLCQIYWYPIYAYIRRQGRSPADAQDLTQGFFEHLLARGFLRRVEPERGRFRSFLIGALRFYLANAREKEQRIRRGGAAEQIPICSATGEQWLQAEATAENDPARAFDRAWAAALIHEAMLLLEQEQAAAGRLEVFAALKSFLQRSASAGEYDELAHRLGMTKGAVAVAVHRLNHRFGEIVRACVAGSVASPEMAEDEMRFLFDALHG